jgi:hypothetical protein
MRKRGLESTGWSVVIVVTAALVGAAGPNLAALAQQAQTAAIAADDLFTGPDSADFKGGLGKGSPCWSTSLSRRSRPARNARRTSTSR